MTEMLDIVDENGVPAGETIDRQTAHEIEELGIADVSSGDLHYCGQRIIKMQEVFHGKLFVDNQVSNIYCLWRDVDPAHMRLQESEIEEVRWMNLDHCIELVQSADKNFPHCIYLEELEMLQRKLKT